MVIGLAGPAQADPDTTDPGLDASFMAALDKAGITYTSRDGVVSAAKTACQMMDRGQPEIDVIKHVTEQNPGFTISGAAKFTAIAASAYCPDHLKPADNNGGANGGT